MNKVPGLTRAQPLKELIDPKKTALAIVECFQNKDPEGAMEMIVIYLNTLNKAKLSKQVNKAEKT